MTRGGAKGTVMDIQLQVKNALEEIAVLIRGHGGDVEFVELDPENIVRVRLSGACGGCPMAAQTLKNVVEARLRQKVPEVARVEAV